MRLLQERVFNGMFGDVVIYVEEVSASQVALRGLLVSDERDPKVSRIIHTVVTGGIDLNYVQRATAIAA